MSNLINLSKTMTNIQKAINWFNGRGISARETDYDRIFIAKKDSTQLIGSVTLNVEGYDVIISEAEVDFRAELWNDENQIYINDVDGTLLKSGDNVIAIDVEDLDGSRPQRGEMLRVGNVYDLVSNHIEFISNKDNEIYAFYGHRVLKIK